jgi:hypothetical protein
MRERRIAPPAALLLCAILVAGIAAGIRVSHTIWTFTAIVGAIVFSAAAQTSDLPGLAAVDVRELPQALRDRVRSAFAHLPEGEARRLLLGVVIQARLIFGRSDSRFDAAEEAQLAEHVTGLVDACCATAADLAQLAQFATGAPTAAGSADLIARVGKAGDLFRERLTNATGALAELYTSNVESGTPSTDRVAELTAAISADASARAAAVSEMRTLLGES